MTHGWLWEYTRIKLTSYIDGIWIVGDHSTNDWLREHTKTKLTSCNHNEWKGGDPQFQ